MTMRIFVLPQRVTENNNYPSCDKVVKNGQANVEILIEFTKLFLEAD